jgi:hypothetical protein
MSMTVDREGFETERLPLDTSGTVISGGGIGVVEVRPGNRSLDLVID